MTTFNHKWLNLDNEILHGPTYGEIRVIQNNHET